MNKFMLVVLMVISIVSLFSETIYTTSNHRNPLVIDVVSSNDQSTTIQMTLNQFEKNEIQINGDLYNQISLKKEGSLLQAGYPDLPFIGRSIVINYQSKPEVQVLESEYTDYNLIISPSKGSLHRDVNPADVSYTFSDIYKSDQFYPQTSVSLGEPYIMRELRGVTVGFTPFQYNAINHTLRVYTKLKVKVINNGIDTRNVMQGEPERITSQFKDIYENHFINYRTNPVRYVPILEQGTMLIITAPTFAAAMTPFVEWKKQKGIPVTLVTTTETGTTSTAIKNYIQNYYSFHPELAYIQLVGDAAQVPSLSYSGGGSDPSYVMLAGNDFYPELFISRFSAENIDQVNTQVNKVIWYERDIADGDWIQKAIGIASSEGGGGTGDMGESDITHENLIRTDLLNYGYTLVDQFYEPSATISNISNALNEGRGFINYTGHGSDTSWGTTGYSNSNVASLTNDYKLPVIVSVACVNGNFTSTTCFAEAWLRAKNNLTGNPTGAVTTYMSTVNQAWNEPMRGQDIITDLMIADNKYTLGGLFFNGSCGMLDGYSNNTNSKETIATWTIFGDASITFRSKTPQAMTVNAMDILFIGSPVYNVSTGVANSMVCLYNPDTQQIISSGVTDQTGNISLLIEPALTEPCTLTLTITAKDYITNIHSITVIPNEGPYVTLEDYSIANGQSANFGSTVNLDCTFKNIGNIGTENLNAILRTNSPYITILDSVAVINILNPDGISLVQDAFSFAIASNVPDMESAFFSIILNDDQNRSWSMNFSIDMYAPVIEVQDYEIIDLAGNFNNQIDPGESVILRIPLKNIGHANTQEGTFSIVVLNDYVHLDNSFYYLDSLAVNGELSVEIPLTADAETPLGSPAQIGYMISYGMQNTQGNILTFVGLESEGFESGDFNAYTWIQSGNLPWVVINSGVDEGDFCAKSGAITHNQSSEMSISRILPSEGTISFNFKVSSEANYDYLQFYIDSTRQMQWSGILDWSTVSYNVPAGTHIFKWKYIKDARVSSNSDCAWVDQIVFPSAGEGTYNGSYYLCDQDTLIFSGARVNTTMTKTLNFINFGSSLLNVNLTAPTAFTFDNGLSNKSIVIPANSNVNEQINFMPTEEISYTNYLRVTTNDNNNPADSIYLSATLSLHNNSNEIQTVITELKGNYPNPFNPVTTIHFSLKESQMVTVNVYNTKGQLVKKLVSGLMPKGQNKVIWNGKDNNERSVSSGVYFYQLQSKDFKQTKKMLLIK